MHAQAEQGGRRFDGGAAGNARAQTVERDERARHEHERRDAGRVLGALGREALVELLVDGVGRAQLEHGDRRRERRDQHEQVKQEADEIADAAHVGEHRLHRGEQQSGAGAVLHAEGGAGGHDGHAGHERDERVRAADDERVALQVLLLAEIGAVGHHDAEADRQREEHLPGGTLEHAAEADVRIAEHGEVGAEHEPVALCRAGLARDVEDDEHEQAEQRRHADVAELFDAALHTAGHDEDVEQDIEHEKQDHAVRIRQKIAEKARALAGPGKLAPAEDGQKVAGGVAQDDAAEHEVKAHDAKAAHDARIAEPGVLLRQAAVGAHGALAAAAAERELAEHDRHTHEHDEHEIQQQEHGTAALAHFIREAPDVAEADGRADRGHEEAEVAAPAAAFGFDFCIHEIPPDFFTFLPKYCTERCRYAIIIPDKRPIASRRYTLDKYLRKNAAAPCRAAA